MHTNTHITRLIDRSGQTMAEYSVVLAVIVTGAIVAVGLFGASVADYLDAFAGAIS